MSTMLFKRPSEYLQGQNVYDLESSCQLYWIKYLAMVCYVADKKFYSHITTLFRRGMITRMELMDKIIYHVYIDLDLVV